MNLHNTKQLPGGKKFNFEKVIQYDWLWLTDTGGNFDQKYHLMWEKIFCKSPNYNLEKTKIIQTTKMGKNIFFETKTTDPTTY